MLLFYTHWYCFYIVKILHENRVDMTKKKRYNIEVVGAIFV